MKAWVSVSWKKTISGQILTQGPFPYGEVDLTVPIITHRVDSYCLRWFPDFKTGHEIYNTLSANERRIFVVGVNVQSLRALRVAQGPRTMFGQRRC